MAKRSVPIKTPEKDVAEQHYDLAHEMVGKRKAKQEEEKARFLCAGAAR
jgi:hypothetical protein